MEVVDTGLSGAGAASIHKGRGPDKAVHTRSRREASPVGSGRQEEGVGKRILNQKEGRIYFNLFFYFFSRKKWNLEENWKEKKITMQGQKEAKNRVGAQSKNRRGPSQEESNFFFIVAFRDEARSKESRKRRRKFSEEAGGGENLREEGSLEE